jgi:hypothetical protein
MTIAHSLIALAALFYFSFAARLPAAAAIVFQQLPAPIQSPGLSSPKSFEPHYPGHRTADDFTLEANALISDVHWWGRHHPPMSSGYDDFTFTFYEDVNGLPGDVLLETRVANELVVSQEFPWLNVYRARLSEPFSAISGTRYWLSIFNADPNAVWVWGNSSEGNSESASLWLPFNNGWDLNTSFGGDGAFQMAVIPEPGTGVLFAAIAVTAGIYRYRRSLRG